MPLLELTKPAQMRLWLLDARQRVPQFAVSKIGRLMVWAWIDTRPPAETTRGYDTCLRIVGNMANLDVVVFL